MISVQFLLMAVAGGLHSLWGPLVGVASITVLKELLRGLIPLFLPEAGGEYEIIVFGIILMVMMIFLPEGLTSLFKKIIRPAGLLFRERGVLHEHPGGP
jgi:branched-chain amino acid transport system permease protein